MAARAPGHVGRARGDDLHVTGRHADVLRREVRAAERVDRLGEVAEHRRARAAARERVGRREHDHALAAAHRQTGGRGLERHRAGQAHRVGDRGLGAVVDPHAASAEPRAARGRVDGDHRRQSGAPAAADQQLLVLEVRGQGAGGADRPPEPLAGVDPASSSGGVVLDAAGCGVGRRRRCGGGVGRRGLGAAHPDRRILRGGGRLVRRRGAAACVGRRQQRGRAGGVLGGRDRLGGGGASAARSPPGPSPWRAWSHRRRERRAGRLGLRLGELHGRRGERRGLRPRRRRRLHGRRGRHLRDRRLRRRLGDAMVDLDGAAGGDRGARRRSRRPSSPCPRS